RSSCARGVVARAIFAILSGWSFAWSLTLIRIGSPRQQLYGMNERHVQTTLATAARDLQQAPRIRGRDHPRTALPNSREFSLEQVARQLRLQKIVDAGAPAAEVAVRQLDEPQPGDAAQELPRLLLEPLAMCQVTGVMIRHRQIERPQRKIRRDQDLDDVAHARREARQLGNPDTVLLHRRTAAGRVGDDEVEVVGKRRGEGARPGLGGLRPTRVELEGAAASLRARDHDLEAGQG